MKISELGEFGLIDRIKRFVPASSADVVVGIGDDVAVLQTEGGSYLLATCDAQVQNIHFLPGKSTPYQLGRKIVAINVSDIAAMGGSPAWALVSLGLPSDTEVDYVDELYRGMQEQMEAAGACIVGGNMSGTRSEVMLDLFLLGHVLPDHLVCRSGAKEGDLVLVTGELGDSRAGLELIRSPGVRVSDRAYEVAMRRYLTPQPRLSEGQALGRSRKVHAMLDVSDGLVSDLGHICRASKVGAEIWVQDVPLGYSCQEVAAAAGLDALHWALTGGEDYELLFALPPSAAPQVQALVLEETGTTSRVIGRITSGTETIDILSPDGSRRSLTRKGWDHFHAQ
jgi:thiamine-monophosphate kinase